MKINLSAERILQILIEALTKKKILNQGEI